MFSRVFSAMRVGSASRACTSFTWESARALMVAWLMAPLAYSSCTAMVRSALSMETFATLAAASTVTRERSETGLARVGMVGPLMVSAAHSRIHPRIGAPQQFHSRKAGGACQGNFGALHHDALRGAARWGKIQSNEVLVLQAWGKEIARPQP